MQISIKGETHVHVFQARDVVTLVWDAWMVGWLLWRFRFVTLSSSRLPVAAVSRTRDRRLGLFVVSDILPDGPDHFRRRFISGVLRQLIRNKRKITRGSVRSLEGASLSCSGI